MKKIVVAREVADSLHATEASLEAALVSARRTLERMTAAKAELGLTGTMGDAALARVRESIAAMEHAGELMMEGHREAYRIHKTVDPRNRAEIVNTPPGMLAPGEDSKVA